MKSLVLSLVALGVAVACLWKVAVTPDAASSATAASEAEAARLAKRCDELSAKLDDVASRVTMLERLPVAATVTDEPVEADRADAPAAAESRSADDEPTSAATAPARGGLREKLRQFEATQDAAEKLKLARELAKSDQPIEQLAGVRALAQLAPAEAAPIAERMLAEMRDGKRPAWQVADVVHALEQAGDVHVLDAYVADERANLASSDATARSRAVYDLGLTRSAKVVPVVVTSLTDSNEWVRLQALDALRATGDEKSASAVEPLLDDPVAAVRDRAVRTLDTLRRRGDESNGPAPSSLRDEIRQRMRRRGGR
jgi:hypothetical protein